MENGVINNTQSGGQKLPVRMAKQWSLNSMKTRNYGEQKGDCDSDSTESSTPIPRYKLYKKYLAMVEDVEDSVKMALKKIAALEKFISENRARNEKNVQTNQINPPKKAKLDLIEPDTSEVLPQMKVEVEPCTTEAIPPNIETMDCNQNTESLLNLSNSSNRSRQTSIKSDDDEASSQHQPSMYEVFLDNLDKRATNENVSEVFTDAGFDNFIVSVKNRITHSFAFVKLKNEDDLCRALACNKSLSLLGRKLGIRRCGAPRNNNSKKGGQNREKKKSSGNSETQEQRVDSLAQQISNLEQRTPNYEKRRDCRPQRTPNYEERIDHRVRRTPSLEKSIPNLEPRAPDYEERAPDYKQRAPDYEERTPDYKQRAPDYDKRTPDYKQRAPDYELMAPDYELMAPDYELMVPDYELRVPDYDRGGSNYEGRGSNYKGRGSNYEGRGSHFKQRGSSYKQKFASNDNRYQKFKKQVERSRGGKQSPNKQKGSKNSKHSSWDNRPGGSRNSF